MFFYVYLFRTVYKLKIHERNMSMYSKVIGIKFMFKVQE